MVNRLNALAPLLAAALAVVAMPAQADVADLVEVPGPPVPVVAFDGFDPILDMFDLPDACRTSIGIQAEFFSSIVPSDAPVSCMQSETVETCDDSDPICQVTCQTGVGSGWELYNVDLPEKIVLGAPVYADGSGHVGTFGHVTICLL